MKDRNFENVAFLSKELRPAVGMPLLIFYMSHQAYRKVRMLHVVDVLVKLGQLDILSTHFEVFSSQQPTRFHMLSCGPFANLQDVTLVIVIRST